MIRKMAAVFFAMLLIASLVPNLALADTDNQPPKLTDFSINASSFNAGDTLTVTIHATDDSGVSIEPNKGWVIFKRKSDSNWSEWFEINKSSDSTTFIASDTIDPNIWQTGTDYYIGSIKLTDTQENTKTYSVQNGDFLENDFSVSNTLRSDWSGPVMTALSVDKTSANVGDTITFDVTANDPSGLSHGIIHIASDRNIVQKDIPLSPTGNANELNGSFVVPQDLPGVDYTISMVSLEDSVCNNDSYNNWSTYLSDDNLPDNMQYTITINNPDVPLPSTNCKLESIEIAPQQVKQGDPVTITVHLDPEGNQLSDMCYVRIGPVAWGADSLSTMDFGLNKTSNGVYSRTWTFPVNWPTGDYMISDMDITNSTGQSMQIEYPDSYKGQGYKLAPQIFNVGSIFSGTDNISIKCGDSFDKMSGVNAGNTTEGNLTDKIEVSGDVDTTKVGIYLVRYKIKSSQDPTQFNKTGDLYYYDIRWVGVTEVTPPASDTSGTLVVTNDSVTIGAGSSDVALSKNGSAINFSQTVSTPGSYTVSVKQSGGASISSLTLSPQTNAGGKGSVHFVIDRTGPIVNPTWTGVSSHTITVCANSSDLSGIAQLKWIAGSASLANARANGHAFTKTFVVNSFGIYTIYAKDKLGNESIKTVNVRNIPVTSISLSKKSAVLSKGGKLQLTVTIKPTNATFKNIIWSSGNSSVAVVDSTGHVRAIKRGKAYIYAKTANGKVVKCLITVK